MFFGSELSSVDGPVLTWSCQNKGWGWFVSLCLPTDNDWGFLKDSFANINKVHVEHFKKQLKK